MFEDQQCRDSGSSICEIILASGSPRRRQLFEILKIPHRVITSDVDERSLAASNPREFALKAAFLKAGALDNQLPTGAIVVAADTVVAFGEQIYFKPDGPDDAERMLSELAANTHKVITGIAVREVGKATLVDAVTTDVKIKPLTEQQIKAYVDSGEPLDKAGAYGIQGLGGQLVEQIVGDYFNVVGLPVDKLLEMLDTHVDTSPYRSRRRELTPELFRQMQT